MASVTIYYDRVYHLLRSPSGLVRPYIEGKAREVVALSKIQVGVKTNALRSSITYSMGPVGAEASAKVKAHDWKALLHHEGSRPHNITGNLKKLSVPGAGTVYYRKTVRHPGTKPNRYLTDSLKRAIN